MRGEDGLDPGQQQLLHAHDGSDGRHVIGVRGPSDAPLAVGFGNGVERVWIGHSPTVRPGAARLTLPANYFNVQILARGGVLGAMETGYQRGRIQDESMLYEQRKHDGTLPLIGVNTFRNPAGTVAAPAELARATEEEKKSQLERVRDFTEQHREPAHAALAALKEVARSGGNVFAARMDAARVCSMQQITEAFFEVGGQYRRNV